MVSRETTFTRRCPPLGLGSSSNGFQGTANQLRIAVCLLAQSALDSVLSAG